MQNVLLLNKNMWYNYEIVGVKVGTVAAHQVKRRQRSQKHLGQMILREEHHCIYEASKRELELQKEKGYPVDSKPYWKVVQMTTPQSCITGGKVAGRMNVESGHLERIRSAGGKTTAAMRVQCPYCNIISNPGVIGRWHGNNCKHKK